MNILAIDTSGPEAGCALMIGNRIVYSEINNCDKTHSETILGAIDRALTRGKITIKALDAIAAVIGPGSFTGVRLGTAMAKGLSHAAGIPCIGIDALDVLAQNGSGFKGIICPILDARRAQVYTAIYRTDSVSGMEKISGDMAISVDELLKTLPEENCMFVGDGVELHKAAILQGLGARAWIPPIHQQILRPEAVCEIALGRQDEWSPAVNLRPLYLRKPQAERERERKLSEEQRIG